MGGEGFLPKVLARPHVVQAEAQHLPGPRFGDQQAVAHGAQLVVVGVQVVGNQDRRAVGGSDRADAAHVAGRMGFDQIEMLFVAEAVEHRRRLVAQPAQVAGQEVEGGHAGPGLHGNAVGADRPDDAEPLIGPVLFLQPNAAVGPARRHRGVRRQVGRQQAADPAGAAFDPIDADDHRTHAEDEEVARRLVGDRVSGVIQVGVEVGSGDRQRDRPRFGGPVFARHLEGEGLGVEAEMEVAAVGGRREAVLGFAGQVRGRRSIDPRNSTTLTGPARRAANGSSR